VRLFGAPQTFTTTTTTVDVAALWRMIEAAPAPPPEPTLPSNKPWVRPKDLTTPPKWIKQARTYAALAMMLAGVVGCSSAGEGGGGIMFAIVGAVSGWFVWPRVPAEKMAAALSKIRSAETQWNSLLARWQKEASTDAYNKLMLDLKGARSTLEALPGIRADGIRKLEQERLAEQKQRYLDRFRIDNAVIPNIGASRTTTLASFGIETAADIEKRKILRITGFGEALAGELLKWKARHEKNFRFNPAEPVNPAAITRLDAEIDQRRRMAISSLQKGPSELRSLTSEIINARARLAPALDRAWHDFKVAQSEHEAL
jgi:DNA-binding helix-hairpin-helix protein with protein kinase domain